MSTYEVKVSERVQAEAGSVYRVLADYRDGHPHVLPKPYFQSLEVEEGGIGAGTIIRVRMKALGVATHLRMYVSEPEPGRLLQEDDPVAGITTFFLMEPEPERSGCIVTLHTVWRRKKGFAGWLESKLNPPIARSIYTKELALIKMFCEKRHNE
ncbi:SRPBCC family protein [Paenibacillus hamazuiensis]|uniref:SRPBCC family protein n=1 Tax=Paenibacillus hamazuiensis TaxID=2936508 RepID=UPI002010AF3E|nr:SRPBCC family protein [Paenibacillus hamazuiensis]